MRAKAHSKQSGSLEGRLQSISQRGGQYLVTIRDELSGNTVECRIQEQNLFRAMTAFGQRVTLYGCIHYLRNGKPVRAEVERMVRFPEPDLLPSIDQVRGILR